MIKQIIFDCDGVLIDSEVLSFAVDRRLLPEYGVDIAPDDLVRRFGGVTYGEMIAALNAEFGTAIDVGAYQSRCEETLNAMFRTELRVIDGMADLVASLRVPVALASGSDLDRLDLCLSVTGIRHLFEGRIFSAEQVAHGKPEPDVFLFAADQTGFDPKDCLVIEDSPAGIVAAQAAGMTSVGFLGGGHRTSDDADMLRDAGAIYVAVDGAALGHYLRGIGLI